jgi:DNA-binding IclR family transcriptional regulator
MVSLCTPAASAASAPRRLGTSAITVRPGSVRAWRTTSAASAICGSNLAGTKEATSISRRPAACKAVIQRILSAVGMVALTDCRPSRGPTSLTGRVLTAFGPKPAGTLSARDKNLYARIREQGYFSAVGDRLEGVAGISAPVFRADGSLAAALTLTMPSNRYSENHVRPLLEAARRLSGLV